MFQKNALLSIFWKDSKNYGGQKQNIADNQSNMLFEKNDSEFGKSSLFKKYPKSKANPLPFSIFPFKIAHYMSYNSRTF